MIEIAKRTARYILSVQHGDGAIPWFKGGILDPWDHVEAAMGLSVTGHHDQAEAAYQWLAHRQRDDGAWLAAYLGNNVADGTRAETNFVAYIATGVWHHFLATGNDAFLRSMWPTVEAAIGFVLGLQAESGEIYWAWDTRTGINKDALVTGCSSIYLSLGCAVSISERLGKKRPAWPAARTRLGQAIRNRPERFDRTWESKGRYSMDWFYPVMTGVIRGDAAVARLESRWHEFVEPDFGCRCVADQPWVTVAETCELVLACLSVGDHDRALSLFNRLQKYQAEDGSWGTGYVFKDRLFWPDERSTWTAGAVLLAIDALTQTTPAARLFTHPA
ncbi:MAG: prenyltransferase [Proteobacteria bacterium]|nr:prenyltransferase [Pseudomonadota bacterium]